MKILFLSKYGALGSSSRYRIYQYLDGLQQKGITFDVHCLLDNWYIQRLYSQPSKWGKLNNRIPLAYLRRLAKLKDATHYDIVFVEKEIFPYLPFDVERWLCRRGVKLVVDYDDAIFHQYESIPLLKQKIPRVMASAVAVVVGNSYLAEYAWKYNSRVYIVPTCLDVKKYQVKSSYGLKDDTVVIGWIGSPATEKYLQLVERPLGNLARRFNIILKCIGVSRTFDLPGIKVKKVPWSEATEARELLEIDIGIMPLTDDPFSRGKCGLKLLQYMACAIPVIASPVGVNKEIVKEGENGFLACTQGEWEDKISLLARNTRIRGLMGKKGREIVESHFSLEKGLDKLLMVFTEVSKTS
ncbi:hypothetical protein MTBGP_07180 [Moorella thermoacetica]|uniref:glycosyltransferase family 4 protein n=1 Tax=Neomoorella thermoacetica TaxID=1525 RepID=UPI0030CD9A19